MHDMALESDLTQKVTFDFPELSQFGVPTHSRNGLYVQDRSPFRGQYDFHLDLKHKDASKDYKLHLGESGQNIIFVNRDRVFVLRTVLRLPLTPLNLFIRIIPLYTCPARLNERVCRCLNHSKGGSGSENESFITVQSPVTKYCDLDGHLTVLIPLDRQQMAPSVKSCIVDKESDSSQASPACSYPMGEVTVNLICRAGCYSSCLGVLTRGAVELIIRLEEFLDPTDPLVGIKLHGLDRVELRCSSTPSRDIRLFLEATTSKSSPLHSEANEESKSSNLSRRRGISEPAARRKSKRLLSLKEPSEESSSEKLSPDYLPTFVDIPTSGGKSRYYVVLTASKERAKELRFKDDALAAFDGTRMSSSAFRANRDGCQKAEAFLAAVYQLSVENSQHN